MPSGPTSTTTSTRAGPTWSAGSRTRACAPDEARLAVAEVAAGQPPVAGRRRVREEQVDVSALGGGARAGRTARAAGRAGAPRRTSSRPARPSGGVARRAAEVRAAHVAAADWCGASPGSWSSPCSPPAGRGGPAQPRPPAVREEANRLPVTWYAQGELHLDDVVVELPGRRGVRRRLADGRRGRRDRAAALGRAWCGWTPDGEVQPTRRVARRPRHGRPRRRAFLPPGRYDVRVQSVPAGRAAAGPTSSTPRGATANGHPATVGVGRRAGRWSSARPCRPAQAPVTVPGGGTVRLRVRSSALASRPWPRRCGQVWRRRTRGASRGCARRRSRRWSPDLPPGGRLLDVGCGTGALVQAAREAAARRGRRRAGPRDGRARRASARRRRRRGRPARPAPRRRRLRRGRRQLRAQPRRRPPGRGARARPRGGARRVGAGDDLERDPAAAGGAVERAARGGRAVEPVLVPRLPADRDFERSPDGLAGCSSRPARR